VKNTDFVGSAPTSEHSQTDEQTVIPVIQEELDVHTRRVEVDSGVRVHKHIQEREEIIDEPLVKEDVSVERVAVNRHVDGPIAVRYEGETMIIPILEEVLVVEKRLVLKEEIRVTRRRKETRAPQRVPLRREVATVERIEEPRPAMSPNDVNDFEASDRPAAESLLDSRRRQQEELRQALGPPPPRDE
jgi:uncharacterized protein (TIGR02271 family)